MARDGQPAASGAEIRESDTYRRSVPTGCHWMRILRCGPEEGDQKQTELGALVPNATKSLMRPLREVLGKTPEEAERQARRLLDDLGQSQPPDARFRPLLRERIAEVAAGSGPDQPSAVAAAAEAFDRAWIGAVLEASLEGLRSRLHAEGRADDYAVFERADVADAGNGAEDALNSDHTTLHEIRVLFRDSVSREVMAYCRDEADAREELRWILG